MLYVCVFTIWSVHHIFWILRIPSVGGFIALKFPQTSVCATPVFDSFIMFHVYKNMSNMCKCATYSWSEVRILESGFIGSIWVCMHSYASNIPQTPWEGPGEAFAGANWQAGEPRSLGCFTLVGVTKCMCTVHYYFYESSIVHCV